MACHLSIAVIDITTKPLLHMKSINTAAVIPLHAYLLSREEWGQVYDVITILQVGLLLTIVMVILTSNVASPQCSEHHVEAEDTGSCRGSAIV